MKFTKEQISELMCKHAQKENGLQDLMEIIYDLSQLCSGDTGHDLYHQLDRKAQQRFPSCYTNESCNAQRGLRPDTLGQRGNGA